MDSAHNNDDLLSHVLGRLAAAFAQYTQTARQALLTGPSVVSCPTHVVAADWPPLSDVTPAMPERGGGERRYCDHMPIVFAGR